MAEPILGEIRMFAGNFAPPGWALCDGQILSVASNRELARLLGTTYGGDGQSTFALPDLRGRVPIHRADGLPLGTRRGLESVQLQASHLPPHSHPMMAEAPSTTVVNADPAGRALSNALRRNYARPLKPVDMSPNSVGMTGGGRPHANMGPYASVNFILCVQGVPPTATGPRGAPQFLGEIRLFAGPFIPEGWLSCAGQAIPIGEFTRLFSIIGTIYGGDGTTLFALPDIRGRAPLHAGAGPNLTSRRLGETGGASEVALTAAELPSHRHPLRGAGSDATDRIVAGRLTAQLPGTSRLYRTSGSTVAMATKSIVPVGGGRPHNTMQPFLVLHFGIAIDGVRPSSG